MGQALTAAHSNNPGGQRVLWSLLAPALSHSETFLTRLMSERVSCLNAPSYVHVASSLVKPTDFVKHLRLMRCQKQLCIGVTGQFWYYCCLMLSDSLLWPCPGLQGGKQQPVPSLAVQRTISSTVFRCTRHPRGRITLYENKSAKTKTKPLEK